MKKKLNYVILIFLILGILGGIFLPEVMKELSFLGNVYLNLLKFMIIPLVFTSIMASLSDNAKKQSKIVIKTVITFIIMFVISFLITSLIVYLVKPGEGYVLQDIVWDGTITKIDASSIINNLFPTNLALMFSNNSLFFTIILAVLCGIASSKIDGGHKVASFVKTLRDLLYKVFEYILYITPIGVFSLIGSAFANNGINVLSMCSKYILMAYFCSIVVLILVMIIPVLIVKKIDISEYLKRISRVWLMTLSTRSSSAALPYTIKCCEDEFKVSSKFTNLIVPLGCTIHMCGGAVSFALLGLFVAEVSGITITLGTFLTMIALATFINMAAPGIPQGGIILGATYLTYLNLPIAFIGLYSGFYFFLDMIYTTLNVTGDITANILLSSPKD